MTTTIPKMPEPEWWAREDGTGSCSAREKALMPHWGFRWPEVVKLYNVPLYAADQLRAWAAACVEQERERAAQIALDEKVDADATGEPDDAAYNAACEHIAAAIRKEPTPDTKGKA